jgi:hypothetical protein
LEQHRALQARVGAAAACALRLREAQSSGTPRVVSASVRGFELPMLKKPTTKEGEAKETAGVRRGHLLRVELDDGRVGWGEASPLPGLHAESAEDAGAQLRAMAALLDGGDRGGVGGIYASRASHSRRRRIRLAPRRRRRRRPLTSRCFLPCDSRWSPRCSARWRRPDAPLADVLLTGRRGIGRGGPRSRLIER